MKHLPTILIFAVCLTAAAGAEDTTALQVAPSDTVIYPDASQILNKTEPKAAPAAAPKTADVPQTAAASPPGPAAVSAVPSARPLTASVPVPAGKAPAAGPAAARPATGWFLRWTFENEASARAWSAASGRTLTLRASAGGRWEALQGPLDAGSLKAALEGQAGLAGLIRL